ncbi:MAG: 2-oxoglutarate synthase subunit alpha [Helicobacteraceae bacterium]|jgi:2-oxoglutarate ferredoxin oxidoreductase subunit alpha|nr:2-oxoglutarate synthase subunit alpha [Helicobacteraceae bacterium]
MREIICNGNELAARAAIDAGCRFFGGYPITPSSEIAHEMSVLLPKVGGKFIQMEDEIAGVLVAIGAAASGLKALTATSGPGMSLKSESFGLAFMYETPLVCVDVMRGGPSTGLPTRVAQGDVSFARNPTFGDVRFIALCPGTLAEAYTETIRAFNLAERFMTPVIVLLDETIGHMHSKAILPDLDALKIANRKRYDGDRQSYKPYDAPPNEPATLNPFFAGYRYHITGLHHGATGFPTEDAALCQKLIERLIGKIDNHQSEIESVENYLLDDAEIAVIAYGSASLAAKEAINMARKEGIKAGMFRPITLWPSPQSAIKRIGEKYEKALIVELNMGQYALEIERVAKRSIASLNQANGRAIEPSAILKRIKEL